MVPLNTREHCNLICIKLIEALENVSGDVEGTILAKITLLSCSNINKNFLVQTHQSLDHLQSSIQQRTPANDDAPVASCLSSITHLTEQRAQLEELNQNINITEKIETIVLIILGIIELKDPSVANISTVMVKSTQETLHERGDRRLTVFTQLEEGLKQTLKEGKED